MRFLTTLLIFFSVGLSAQDSLLVVVEQLAERQEAAKQANYFQEEVRVTLDLIRASNASGNYAFADSLSLHYVNQADRIERLVARARMYLEAGKAAFFAQDYSTAVHYDTIALAVLNGEENVPHRDSLTLEVQNYLGKAYNASGNFGCTRGVFP